MTLRELWERHGCAGISVIAQVGEPGTWIVTTGRADDATGIGKVDACPGCGCYRAENPPPRVMGRGATLDEAIANAAAEAERLGWGPP